MSYPVGTYLYVVHPKLLGKGYEIERVVVLQDDRTGFAIGDSKDKRSTTMSGPGPLNLPLHATTPARALNLYVAMAKRDTEKRLADLRKKIEEEERHLEEILDLDHTKLKVKSYPDDYVPCDF